MPRLGFIHAKVAIAMATAGTSQVAPASSLPSPASAQSITALAPDLPKSDAQINLAQLHELNAAEGADASTHQFVQPQSIPYHLSPELLDRVKALGEKNGVPLYDMEFRLGAGNGAKGSPVFYGYEEKSIGKEIIMVEGDPGKGSSDILLSELPYSLGKQVSEVAAGQGATDPRVIIPVAPAQGDGPPAIHTYELQKGWLAEGIEGKIVRSDGGNVLDDEHLKENLASGAVTKAEDTFNQTPEGTAFLKQYHDAAIARGVHPVPPLYIDEATTEINADAQPMGTMPTVGVPRERGIVLNRVLLDKLREKSANEADFYEKLSGVVEHELGHIEHHDLTLKSMKQRDHDPSFSSNVEMHADMAADPKSLIDSFRTNILPSGRDQNGKPDGDHPPTDDRITHAEITGTENRAITPADTGYLPSQKALSAMQQDGYYTTKESLSAVQTEEIKRVAAANHIRLSDVEAYRDNTLGAPAVGAAITDDGHPLLFIGPQAGKESPRTLNAQQLFDAQLGDAFRQMKGLTDAAATLQAHHVVQQGTPDSVSAQPLTAVSSDQGKTRF